MLITLVHNQSESISSKCHMLIFCYSANNIRYNDVSCSSQYLTLYQCSYDILGSCGSMEGLQVECCKFWHIHIILYNPSFYICAASERLSDNPYDGQVRLVNGHYSSDGAVEVYCNDQWGAICSTNQNGEDTVCNQLGYTRTSIVIYDSLSM